MAADKLDLYRWDRFSKPRVYSRTQRVTSEDDIQGWIKKVEEASNRAAEVALGSQYVPNRATSRKNAKSTVDYVLTEDSAHSEAQELLQQWMTDKLGFDDNFDDDEADDDTWAKPRKTQSEIKKEWDHLLEMNDPTYYSKYPDGPLTPKSSGRSSSRSKDPYSILNEDPNDVVDDILQNMLEKDFVEDHVVRDLGLTDKKFKDPRTKMKLRQQQVKQNREKRMKELEKQRREKQAKKDAEFQARQQMKQEELKKAEATKKEESEIKREMARIRKEMEEDRKRHEEQKLREKKEAEERDRLAKEELERHIAAEQSEQQHLFQREEEKKRKVMERMKIIQQREAIQNFKILQKYFNAWYDLVLAKRLKMGKARAMADWKCLVRAWNGWKSYVRDKRLEREAYRHQQDVKIAHRKQQMGVQHYRQKLLLKCWLAWQHYVSLERQRKDVHAEQDVTRNKMASFLQAAASGQLWTKEDEIGEDSGRESTLHAVDDMFTQPTRQGRWGLDSARSDLTTDRSQGSKSSNKLKAPTEAFQVKREHIKLIKTNGQAGDGSSRSEDTSREEDGEKNHSRKNSWQKPPFVANNMENRHNAQQKILEQQQKQIKEQQKLIKELTYLQKQQLVQQQITTQALLQQQLGKDNTAATDTAVTAKNVQNTVKNSKIVAKNIPKMSNHLDKVQKDLVIEGEVVTARTDSNMTNATSRTEASNTNQTVSSAPGHTSRSNVSTSRTVSSAGSATSRAVKPNPRHDQFLKAMEERAAEREQLKRAREEKRRKEEEEKLARLLQEEAERKEKEEEEKRKRIEAHREKKRLEKQKEIERQKELERMRELTEKAEEHSRLATLRYRGWYRWRRLMEIAREKEQRAEQHYKRSLMRKFLISWHHTVASELHGKRTMADEMYSYILLKRCFYNWRRVGETMQILEEKAQCHYECRLKSKVLQEWADLAASEKIARWHRERQAREHNITRIKRKTFNALRYFPQFIKEEREREKRRSEMRRKVASMLPDFEGSKSARSSVTSSVGDL